MQIITLNFQLSTINCLSILLLQQVGAQTLGAFHSLLHFPVLYFGLVSAQQYVGYFPSLVVGRACIDAASSPPVST